VAVLNRSALRNALRNGLLVASTALLIAAGLATSDYRKATAFGPLFVDPFSLAVDAAGNLYCGVEFERVHKYSPDRKIIGAWSVDASLRPFRLRVAEGSTIEVATSDGKLIRFENTGKTISSQDAAAAFEDFGSANDAEVRTAAGIVYSIEAGSVVRRANGSTTVWLPAPRWPLSWVRSPALLAVLLSIGPIGMIASVVMRRRSLGVDESHGTPD